MNPRMQAQLFKAECEEMFDHWEASKPLRIGYPHASALLTNDFCLRRLVLTQVAPEQMGRTEHKPWDTLINARFLNGWVLHEKWQKLFQQFGNVIEVETPHFDEIWKIHFTPDAIIEFGGIPYIVEIKGYKRETFEKLDDVGVPPPDAHRQANLYMHLLDIDQAFILVECKDSQEIKVWCVEHDHAMATDYTQRAFDVQDAVRSYEISGRLPSRQCYGKSDSKAQKCTACKVCFEKGE